MALTRIAKEHADLQRDPLKTCSAGPAGASNPRQWVGHITGPSDTAYEQRDFSIAIAFPQDYPMKPFQLTFTTPLSHPNISEEGEVRLVELEEKHWSPVFTVRSILICLQALLANPDPSNGVLNSKATRTYLTNQPQEHDVSSSAAKGCVQPTHNGKRIAGKKYGIDMSRPEFEEYKNLTGVEEKNKFLVENADIVRDE
ncbi:UBC-like protein [Decorospora gaudefroyi]|uniref:UBC-like protein n=1 Tax=Decorospora gaudefroyi TaxID=184978 RepID=A0A6A5KIM7_9PLEO|nr:UBC-like protein [Decorospora gaudefroyi]